jgi:hypothetical protein
MLLHLLAVFTSSGVVGSVTQPSTLTCSATASQSFTIEPPSAPSPGTYPWYLDSDASFYMTPHSAHLYLLHSSSDIALFIPLMNPLFLLLDRALFPLTLFMFLKFILFLI